MIRRASYNSVNKSLLSLFLILCFTGYSQTNNESISQIEVLDSSLIGKKIKKAIKLLDVDSNWIIIYEPPGIVRGIWIEEIEGYQIQLLTKRKVVSQLSNKKTQKLPRFQDTPTVVLSPL